MAFINETASEADIEKYGLRDINYQYHFALRDMNCQWTIDRERDIYVRKMGTGREETSSHTTFTFYWKGHLFFWVLDNLLTERVNGHSHSSWGLPIGGQLHLPKKLESMRSVIIDDFKEAMKLNEQTNFLIQPQSYSVDFQF
jgi:hypothetical protein